jgi:hypothetical protein
MASEDEMWQPSLPFSRPHMSQNWRCVSGGHTPARHSPPGTHLMLKADRDWPYCGSYLRDWGVDLRAEWLHGVVFESRLIHQPAEGGSIATQMCTHSGCQGTKKHFHVIQAEDHQVELRKSLGCPKCAEELRGLDILMRSQWQLRMINAGPFLLDSVFFEHTVNASKPSRISI